MSSVRFGGDPEDSFDPANNRSSQDKHEGAVSRSSTYRFW
jgi:hypothetical protein